MKTNKDARWYKVVGGDFGAVKIGRRWERYSCLYCLRNAIDFDAIARLCWQGPPSEAIVRAMNETGQYLRCTKNHG